MDPAALQGPSRRCSSACTSTVCMFLGVRQRWMQQHLQPLTEITKR